MSGPPPPLNKHKNTGFLNKIGPDPLKNRKTNTVNFVQLCKPLEQDYLDIYLCALIFYEFSLKRAIFFCCCFASLNVYSRSSMKCIRPWMRAEQC